MTRETILKLDEDIVKAVHIVNLADVYDPNDDFIHDVLLRCKAMIEAFFMQRPRTPLGVPPEGWDHG